MQEEKKQAYKKLFKFLFVLVLAAFFVGMHIATRTWIITESFEVAQKRKTLLKLREDRDVLRMKKEKIMGFDALQRWAKKPRFSDLKAAHERQIIFLK